MRQHLREEHHTCVSIGEVDLTVLEVSDDLYALR